MSRHSFCFSYSLQIDSLPIKNKRCIHVLYTTAHTKMLIKNNTKLFISSLKAKDMGDTESRRDKIFIKIVCALHHGDWFNYGVLPAGNDCQFPEKSITNCSYICYM